MADSVTPSAFTNPFTTQSEDQGASRLNCPSPHNPFSVHGRPCSPGNPFAPPTVPFGIHGDEVLPLDDTCEPMQPMKLEDMFPFPELLESSSTETSTTTQNKVAATCGNSSSEASTATTNIASTCDSSSSETATATQKNVAATCDRSSDSPDTHLSKPFMDFPPNHVGEDSGVSEWGNNTNNSNHVDEAGDSGFSDGFHDDFGALSHADVIFKTGFLDSNFKAVAVTAEEDDLWSSSFIMEETDGENPKTSGDLESTNQRSATPSQNEEQTSIHFVNFDSIHISGAIPEDEKRGVHVGLSKTPVPLEVDFLPHKEPWDPWPSEDLSSREFAKDQTKNDHDHDQWAPITSQDPSRTENAQASSIQDIFSPQGSVSPADSRSEAEKERNKKIDPFQNPWKPFENPEEDVTDRAMRPRALDLSRPHYKNPFSSNVDSTSSSKQQVSSPFQGDLASLFQEDPTSPFHPQNDPTSHNDSSAFLFPATQLQSDALSTHSDPWSPSLIQGKNGSRGSRSPNPFSPVEDSSTNPFLKDLDLLQGKHETMHQTCQNKIPDIPKFEEKQSGSNKEGASTSAIMEGAAADPEVFSNGTDTLDVAEHDDIFDVTAENTHTDDEFENNERMMEEMEHDEDTKKAFAEVEDIFQNDNHLIDAVDNDKMRKDKEEVEDIFGDDLGNDLHVEEEEHDYEPIFTQNAREEEPVIKITDVNAERSQPEVILEPEVNFDNEADKAPLDVELPFPDMPRKSDISLNWEDVVEEEKQTQQQPSSPSPPPANIDAPLVSIDAPPASIEEPVQEIDEKEVAKFVENILISSMNEVSSQAEEQEEKGDPIENIVEVEASEPVFEVPETTVESDHVLSLESGPEKVDIDVVSEPAVKEDISVSVNASASEHADINGFAKEPSSDERELEIHASVPASVVEVAKEAEDAADCPAPEASKKFDMTKARSKTFDSSLSLDSKSDVEVTKNMDSSEARTRKMSVPRPRDVRKDLSEARPSFFGSSTSGPKPFLSNTLPRVSVLPRISTSYQRKSPTSPMSVSGDYSSFDKEAELPTVAGPDLTKDDTQVINELGALELPLIETLSQPSSPKATAAPVKLHLDADPIVPMKETKVEAGAMEPVFATKPSGKAEIVLDGTSPEEIEAIFAKDPEEEPKKKSMGKDDVIASTRVRKISRTTWKGQDEFQKSVDKSTVVLDEPQAASLKRYQARKMQRFEGHAAKPRTREDSTSEAESEGSQSSHSGPKMPDVVQSGSSNGHPESEIVAPKLNMKSVRSLWEQKAAEVEQRRRSLQSKSRPVSQGERCRLPNSKNMNKSCDDNLDDSIEGSTTYSYDGTSDDGSTKRESLIDREIRLQKERTLQSSKDRDRLRSESTSSRDESQQSETSESQDDQLVDIVRDTELRRDSDDGRSSPSQSSGYTSGRSTPSTPAGDDILKVKTGKSVGKTPELKMSLSPTDPDASSNYKEYQKALKGNRADGKFSKSATFPRRMENFNKQADSSSISPTNSVGDVPDVIMVDGNKSTSPTGARKTSIVQQGIKLSQKLEKKKITKLEKKPRRSLMELEIAAQKEKEEAFRREQQTRKMSTSSDAIPVSSPVSSTTSSPANTPQSSPRKSSVSGPTAKSVYKDLNYAPHTNKKKLALAGHWEHKWK